MSRKVLSLRAFVRAAVQGEESEALTALISRRLSPHEGPRHVRGAHKRSDFGDGSVNDAAQFEGGDALSSGAAFCRVISGCGGAIALEMCTFDDENKKRCGISI